MTSVPTPKQSVKAIDGHPDAGLLFARLESKILAGDKPEQVHGVLDKEALWRRLSAKDRLRWAELAQMAGKVDTACRVLESLHRECPTLTEAWRHHLDLLAVLGRREQLAALLARARSHIDAGDDARWRIEDSVTAPEERSIEAATAPFERHHHRMAALQRFMTLFAGRRDCFARQWADRRSGRQGYVPERRPMTPDDLNEHLAGRKTYGIYLLQADGRVKTAVIDADLVKELRGGQFDAATKHRVRREAGHLIRRIKNLSGEMDAEPLVVFSGSKGYHFWYFFDTAQPPGPVREALLHLIARLKPDLTAFTLEVFPKQDQAGGKGLGNLVKLPLGVHRLTGKRAHFLECAQRSVAAQLDFLSTVRPTDPRRLIRIGADGTSAEVVVHPRFRGRVGTDPLLDRLGRVCPPLGQVMGLCLENGRIALREEKVLYQTIGFLSEGRRLLHLMLGRLSDYNPHAVDYRLSRLRGTPLGCRRIHELLAYTGDWCRFEQQSGYAHPLLHLDDWQEPSPPMAKRAQHLEAALEQLRTAIGQVERFLK